MAAKSNVQALTERIVASLRDTNEDSWPESVIHKAINEAEKVVVNFRPDAAPVNHSFDCEEGIEQDISTITDPPPNRLLSVKFNGTVGSPGRAVRRVGLGDKDAIAPDWRTETPNDTIREFMFDTREPLLFYTSPPATAQTTLQIAYSAIPADYGTVDASTKTTVSSIYEPVLMEWSLYRLFGHDTEGSVNVQRSQQHLQNFQNMMGIKINAEQAQSLKNLEHRS